MKSSNRNPFLLMLLGGCIVGMGPILAKTINAPAVSIVFYRMLLPIPILFVIQYVKKATVQPHEYASKVNDILLMFTIGLFFALDLISFYIALKWTSVASATLLANLSPVFIMTFALIKKRHWSREIVWPMLAFVGLMLLCNIKNDLSVKYLIGDGIALVSALFFTANILLINKLGATYNSIDIVLWSSIGGSLFAFAACLLFSINIHISSHSDLLLLFIMSWGTQLIGQTLLTIAISRFPPSLSSLGILIDPISAAIFAWILLGEALTSTEMLGALFVLISIFCAYRGNSSELIKQEEVVNG